MAMEASTTEVSKRLLMDYMGRDNPTILDVGCYNGLDSVAFAWLLPKATIHAFEADHRSLKICKPFVEEENNITLHEIAIGDIDGNITWFHSNSPTRRHESHPECWSASSSLKQAGPDMTDVFPDIDLREHSTVRCKRLDTWAAEQQVDYVDLIWADVNGAERELIQGGLSLLSRTKLFYTEFSDKKLYDGQPTMEEILKMLPTFRLQGVYNYLGNYGNLLLINTMWEK